MSYLGLDIGTTGCKAAVFDAEGRLLALAYREYPLLSPQPGWAEIDSARVCRDCCDVDPRGGGRRARAIRFAAMGISCQGEAFTPVAASGELSGQRHGLVRRPGGRYRGFVQPRVRRASASTR